jgi:hypothetical protein
MRADEIEIGRQVKLFAPMLAEHGSTGTVVQVHRDPAGDVVTAMVALDGSPEQRWLHRASLAPVDGPADLAHHLHPLETAE